MSSGTRTFAALVEPEGVSLLEYKQEKAGMRVVGHWADVQRTDHLEDALTRLRSMVAERHAKRATLAIALQHFGAFHHLMTLPDAANEVVEPIVRREIQRVFGISDPILSFARGAAVERRDVPRANPTTAPRRVFIAGVPPASVQTIGQDLTSSTVRVLGVTVIPEAIRRVYESAPHSNEPTAVLVCLGGGPHLSFFVDRQMELAIEPPIALEGDHAIDPATIVDQLERGSLFLRQQFRGAQAAEVLLAAPAESYQTLKTVIETRTSMRVRPFAHDLPSPDAVVALGAVLSVTSADAVDLFPHPPTFDERIRASLRGPRGVMTAAVAAALIAAAWLGFQYVQLHGERSEIARLRASVATELPTIAPVKEVALHRASFARSMAAVSDSRVERVKLTEAMRALADLAPASVAFDSLELNRQEKGWSGTLVGHVVAHSAGDAMSALNVFYTNAHDRSGLAQLDLEQFDYLPADTTSAPSKSKWVSLTFRMTLGLSNGENR